MHWYIVGHGALASIWAHHLADAGESVNIITREASGQSDIELTLEAADGTISQRHFALTDWAQLTAEALNNACILVMIKAWQLDDVLTKLAQYKSHPQAIILSHNGLGAGEKVLSAHSDWPVYDLVTTHGAWRRSPYHTVHAGYGHAVTGKRLPTQASAPCLVLPAWFHTLQQALPPLDWEPDILLRRWQKLAINCAINPLASLAGKPNGVLQEKHYEASIRQICAEVAAIADEILDKGVLKSEQLEQQVHQVIKATADNTCSMLQDLHKAAGTEIDYLNGYIARTGESLGIPTPLNAQLSDAIRRLSTQDLSSTNSTTSRPKPDNAE